MAVYTGESALIKASEKRAFESYSSTLIASRNATKGVMNELQSPQIERLTSRSEDDLEVGSGKPFRRSRPEEPLLGASDYLDMEQ